VQVLWVRLLPEGVLGNPNPAPVVDGAVWYQLHSRRTKTPTLKVDGVLDRSTRDDLIFAAD